MKIEMVKRAFKFGGWGGVLTLGGIALLAACTGSEDTSAKASQIVVNAPTAIAQESDADYNNNVNGIITGATLKRWKDNWLTERPAGVTGKLVILQVAAGPATYEYVKPNGLSVFSYLVASADWTQTRSNGVISTPSMVLDGPTVDALLAKYAIDPVNDMVVCAQGTGSTSNAMAQGRCWYTLRYWGMKADHLALLNGSNDWQVTSTAMTIADFQAAVSSTPGVSGTVSVRDLPDDNTALQATLQDMLAIVRNDDTPSLTDGVFLWDARDLGQYSARNRVEQGQDTDAVTAGTQACGTSGPCTPVESPLSVMSTFQNSGSRQGHPNGAVQLQYTRLLDSTKGYSYRDKSVIADYLTGAIDANGVGFVGGDYAALGVGNAYQPGDVVYTYCETTFRAMITGVASTVILGYPTRFYDGAMIEWNSLSHLQDASGNYILPADSPWRTDLHSYFRPAQLTDGSGTVDPTKVAQRVITNAYANSANAVVIADRAYKVSGASGSGDGNTALPVNPCGG